MVELGKVSVVVPHYNNLQKLDTCLLGLQQQNELPASLEIIVVDNRSTVDLSKIKIKHPEVIWLSEASMQSPYPTRNRGIRSAGGDIIVLLDSNCFPLPIFFQQGLAMLANGYDVCGGQLLLVHSRSAVSRFDVLYSALRPSPELVTCLPGGVLFVRRIVFDDIGLFLNDVRSLADIEWSSRAFEQGFKLGITPQSVARYTTKEFSFFCKKMFRLGRGKKEIYVQKGGRLWHPRWFVRVVKSFLPPNPGFVKRMHQINITKETHLNFLQIVFFCWLTKVLRGVGMIIGGIRDND